MISLYCKIGFKFLLIKQKIVKKKIKMNYKQNYYVNNLFIQQDIKMKFYINEKY